MDAIAGLAFGIIVINVIRQMGVQNDEVIAGEVLHSGILAGILMALIYMLTILIGTQSLGLFTASENGGIALSQISSHYLGRAGILILAVTITFACLKTSIGLVISCAETFEKMFPHRLSYTAWAVLFTAFSFLISNAGLSTIIRYSVPVLMLIYPPAIALILLALFERHFNHDRKVYFWVTVFTWSASLFDFFKALPEELQSLFHLDAGCRICGTVSAIFRSESWLDPARHHRTHHRTFIPETSENPAGLRIRPQGFLTFRSGFVSAGFPLPFPAFPVSLCTDNVGYRTYPESGSGSLSTVLL